jgi:SAM-dependent MidA family methyltransferase
MGAGNGTLMKNILDYIEEHEPQVYKRTRYKVIEISENLAEQQRQLIQQDGRHVKAVEIVHQSILEWNTTVPEPCFVIALEVLVHLVCVKAKGDRTTLRTISSRTTPRQARLTKASY